MNKAYEIQAPNRNIIFELEKSLIKPKYGLELVYKGLIKYFHSANQLSTEDVKKKLVVEILDIELTTESLTHHFSEIKLKNIRNIAIDFPIILKSLIKNTNDTLMIVAMDPLTKNANQSNSEKNKIGYWVPFSLIDSEFTGEGTFKLNTLFFKELLKHYNLYVTDIYKMFYRIGDYPNDLRSSKDKDYTIKLKELHTRILINEIEIAKPKAIITIGNSSRNALLEIQKIKQTKWDDVQIHNFKSLNSKIEIPIISIPHISGAANGTTTKILNKYDFLMGTKNERLGKLIINKLKDI